MTASPPDLIESRKLAKQTRDALISLGARMDGVKFGTRHYRALLIAISHFTSECQTLDGEEE